MAKTCSIQKNLKREFLINKYRNKRQKIKRNVEKQKTINGRKVIVAK